MRLTRIHVTGPLTEGAEVTLPPPGAYHAAAVLRLRPGAPIVVFDGSGGEYRAEISRVDGNVVSVRLGQHVPGLSESALRISLIQGVSRGERMDWTLQKATELGAMAIVPVLTGRSVVRLNERTAKQKCRHWRGIVIGACEQCGRNHLPDVAMPMTLQQFLAGSRREGMRLVLSPTAPGSLAGLASLSNRVELLIGPEGGLADDEIEAAQRAGFMPVRLGPRVLRTETASVVALTVLQALWGDLR